MLQTRNDLIRCKSTTVKSRKLPLVRVESFDVFSQHGIIIGGFSDLSHQAHVLDPLNSPRDHA